MIEDYKKILREYIAIKSVSTDPDYLPQINNMALWLKQLFESNGFKVIIAHDYANPIIVASFTLDPSLETCLLYGHYDTQPAEQEDGWLTDPFSVFEKDERLYGRGIVDNKGQNLIHIFSIFQLIKEKRLGYNIKFLLEGNEETGSPQLGRFIKENSALLTADFTMISDGEISNCTPTIEVGFRGGFNATLAVTTSHIDLHSGLYGGVVPNAAQIVSAFLGEIQDKNNHICIPHFYDNVDAIVESSDSNTKEEFKPDEFKNIAGVSALIRESAIDIPTQISLRPSISITGLHSGYTKTGYRNSIPGSAFVKLNFRLVLHQNPHHIAQLFEEYVQKKLPSYAAYSITASDFHDGIKLTIDNKYVTKTIQKLEASYSKKVVVKYCGGGLPIVSYFTQLLKIPNVLVPLGNEDCQMHACNENFAIENIKKALVFSYSFFQSHYKTRIDSN